MKFPAVIVFLAVLGVSYSAPVQRAGLLGKLVSGAGFESNGKVTAGATADKDSGIAAGGIDGFGSVLGLAGPGTGIAAAFASPGM